MTELFQIPPSAPSALQKARARLEKAQAEVDRLEEIHDNQGPEIHPQMKAANRELQSAANSVQVEENKALEQLKIWQTKNMQR